MGKNTKSYFGVSFDMISYQGMRRLDVIVDGECVGNFRQEGASPWVANDSLRMRYELTDETSAITSVENLVYVIIEREAINAVPRFIGELTKGEQWL